MDNRCKDYSMFSVFLPSEKENILNVFNLEFSVKEFYYGINNEKGLENQSAVLANGSFDLISNSKIKNKFFFINF